MKTTISSLAALVYLIPGIMATLTINTPFGVTQCQPQMITWSEGTAPYYVSIIPGGEPSAAPLRSWDPQTGNSLTWQVDLPPDTPITMAIKDSTGNTAFSDKVNVRPASPGTACSQNADALAPTAGTSSGSTAGAGTTGAGAAGSASRPNATSGGSANTSQSQTNAARPASSTPAVAVGTASNAPRPSATSASGAVSNLKVGSYGLAGAAGLVAAFFL